jgi:hypothetical protein
MRWTRLTFAIAMIAVGVAGCLRGDPLGWKVSAKDPRALASWRVKIDGALNADHRRRLEQALQEIRMNIAGNRELNRWSGENADGAAAESIDEALCRRIDARPLGEVLQLGYEFRVLRLQQELAGLENAVKQNAQLVTRPGDVDSRHYLEGLHGRQVSRLEKYRADLAAAERELAPLLEASGRRLLEGVEDPNRLSMPGLGSKR